MALQSITYNSLTWIDMPQPTAQDVAYLQEHFPFHPLDFEDLVSGRQRPKIDEYDDYLFVVLDFPVFDKGTRVTKASEIDIFVGANFLITIHKGKVWPLDRLFEACEGSTNLQAENMGKGSGFLLYRIIDKLVDNFFPVAYKIERNVQDIEDAVFADGGRQTVEEISLLRRDIIAYRRIVKPLVPVIARLEFIKGRLIGDELEVYFSDIGDALARIWDTLEDQKGIIEALNDTYDSLTSHRTNEVIRGLTVISVIMLPLTLVSGIYGMNVKLPFDHHPLAFELVLLAMFTVAAAMILMFRHKRWL
ncbi:MAG: magnesium/cobalt transporter CorA [Candidatus Sericytochromatia bacterium]|nr:magnesium/cobalt transporter CorA [Candidatus Sericytochromatia bacterium]